MNTCSLWNFLSKIEKQKGINAQELQYTATQLVNILVDFL